MTTAIAATTLALGLVLGATAEAASPSAKPSAKPTLAGAKTHTAAKGKEGTATHEMSEASTGTAEEGTKKVAKAKSSVIKKLAKAHTKKAAATPSASPSATK